MNKITLGISICALAVSLLVVGLSVHELKANYDVERTHFIWNENAEYEKIGIIHECRYYDDRNHGLIVTYENSDCPSIWKWN